MIDFTFRVYSELLKNLKNSGFCFFDHQIHNIADFRNGIIIRHDVDRKPEKALAMAEIEKELGVKSIYFFRATPGVFKPEIIEKITSLGHSVGFHYESLSEGRKQESTKARKQESTKARKQRRCEQALPHNFNEDEKVRQYEGENQSPITNHQSLLRSSPIQNSKLKTQNCEAEIDSRLTTHDSQNKIQSPITNHQSLLRSSPIQNSSRYSSGQNCEAEIDSRLTTHDSQNKIQSPITNHQSLNFQHALNDFVENLHKFRTICKIRFISAHGSPRSPFDNRDLWKYFDYKDFGIESDFSIIKDEMLYITDAGRSWNNLKVNRRDVSNMENFPDVKSIFEIPEVIQASGSGTVMLNIHPEHWVDSKAEWVYIYLYRKVRNALKRIYLAVFSRRRGERGLESLKAGRTRARKREGGKV